MKKNFTLLFSLIVISLYAQTSLDLESYKSFLEQNQKIGFDQMKVNHNSGYFLSDIDLTWQDALFADSIDIKLELTQGEKNLLAKNGFVVSERLSQNNFAAQLLDIYHKDLPVYISSDAILHAVHESYDNILKDLELTYTIPRLKSLLLTLHSEIPAFANRYGISGELEKYIQDLDAYLTVPLRFMDNSIMPNYDSNNEFVSNFLNLALAENYFEIPFFSSVDRKIDFSQFKPRGHYEDEYHPELAEYFRTMIWLGRMELYLIAPNSLIKPTREDVQRQAIMAVLLSELIDFTESRELVNEIELVINLFVGDQDNVTLDNLGDVMSKAGFDSSQELIDTTNFLTFQDILADQPYADQQILSQVLIDDPLSPEDIKPASAFMLFGQRFVIDSYVTGAVVFDKVPDREGIPLRLLPSTLDVLFAIGNDAALDLLKDELEYYQYETNLSALRYLIDQNEDEFWNKSIYNNWLNSIRSLNPPENRTGLPLFMQTAAWWQQKMNTQLSSWTELRHDNLLYAKQSYTGGVSCSYPYSFVEPVPEFYRSIQVLAESAYDKLDIIQFDNPAQKSMMLSYFDRLNVTADTLYNIAVKELNGDLLDEAETVFLKNMLSEEQVCGGMYDGWFPLLYYNDFGETVYESDFLVADYHTAPTDESGSMVGWVKHAGTGKTDMLLLTATLPSGEKVMFAGPVNSYHEHTTTNFQRLADSEWKEEYLSKSSRPDWVNIYLADETGLSYGSGPSLITSAGNNDNSSSQPESYLLARNYPNPFNPSTVIEYNIPRELANDQVKLTIHNITGEVVTTLINREMPAGTYLTKWNGTNSFDQKVSSGIYFYNISVGDQNFTGKMNLIK